MQQLGPFLNSLQSAADPRSALDWITKARSATARTALLDMLNARSSVDHQTLDDAAGAHRGRATSVEYLRKLLVASSVLPDRDEHLHRTERAIAAELETAHVDDVSILQQYATWRVLAQARARIASGTSSQSVAQVALSNFVIAARFLAWLRNQHLTPQELSQTGVNRWVSQKPSYRGRLATFLRWAGQRRLLPRALLPADVNWPPTTEAPATNQLMLVQGCLTDATLTAPDRLAAYLLTIYGQPLRRISRLRLADVAFEPDSTTIKLGDTPLELPPRVAAILQEVIDQRDKRPGISPRPADDAPWLFPGKPPTQPISSETLRRRITALGVPTARSARNTALTNLAREVPPVVLADLLGISLNAAVRWSELSGGTWTSYAGSRADPRPRFPAS